MRQPCAHPAATRKRPPGTGANTAARGAASFDDCAKMQICRELRPAVLDPRPLPLAAAGSWPLPPLQQGAVVAWRLPVWQGLLVLTRSSRQFGLGAAPSC